MIGVLIITLVFLAGIMLAIGFLIGRLLPDFLALVAGLAVAALVCGAAYSVFAGWGYADTGSTERNWGTWTGTALASLLGVSHLVGVLFGNSARQASKERDNWGPPPLQNDEGI